MSMATRQWISLYSDEFAQLLARKGREMCILGVMVLKESKVLYRIVDGKKVIKAIDTV